jgi:hypothetical protein
MRMFILARLLWVLLAAVAVLFAGTVFATDGPSLAPAPLKYAAAGTAILFDLVENGERQDVSIRVGMPSASMAMFERIGEGVHGFYPACWSCGRHRIELEKYLALWPLQVGNSTELLRTHNEDGRRWRHRISVVRTETISLPFGAVDTFVLEEIVSAEVGPWKGFSTSWFAPSIGWTVRYEARDSEGKYRRHVAARVDRPSRG